uniref:PDZ domain-containing protein n=1 Tax=Seriola lalandi dorsalis TaxID=1841481 RepID=A0A3B4WT87_SERLL
MSDHVTPFPPPLSAAPSLMSHRFVTVRRGSPAARSGQIQPGDQLEAVEARPVGGLQHRDLAQILRRAGNTLRLSITPRHRTAYLCRQVSDQLVEINGDSTTGMTHSQAVEQIRRGGHRIHLVLKKGNGYVPDYGETTHTSADRSTSYSEVSLSAASIATTGWREESFWRRGESPGRQGNTPGPWLKPSPQRLTQVLIGSRLGGRELAAGLSL